MRSKGNTKQKWRAIYQLLFPGVPEDLIPSPYYDDINVQLEKLQRTEVDRFQNHMELAVPRSAERLLERTSFEPLASIGTALRTRIVEIVASAVTEASQLS
ncbi:hypothetical protein CGCSCA2_v002932 [Colletotrichum siamense]|uniref:Uncharacterized protein n=1 Tax=Colletotrichum siamense TaxID=690259 RepID=A0A9P5F1F4_COLSI|nr:hypothetical protein CGCSCA2_v002932 [Colletotrichum siamense]